MGITCKQTGKFRGVIKKLDNQFEKEKNERIKAKSKEKNKKKEQTKQ